MELGTQYRTKLMNQISEADINAEMKIAGWVENIRDHGGVSFIDLRDMYGVMQVVMRDTSLLYGISKEDCLSVEGVIQKIDEETYNTDSVLIGNLFVPQCNSTEYNYYQQTSPTLYGFDEENDNTITAALEASALNGDKYFSIIIDSSLDYDDAYSRLVDEGYVINYIENANNALWGKTELGTSSYAYPNDELRIITIDLNYIY